MFGATNHEKAYVGPFLVFTGLLVAGQLVAKLFEGQAFWVVSAPIYWVFPLQTVACAAILARYWKHYEWTPPKRLVFTCLMAAGVFIIWVAPQEWLGCPRRWEGFDPWFFGHGTMSSLTLALRFIRLVIVVPLLEEIFWRGFLLRYFIQPDFVRVPFGTFRWPAFVGVSFFFAVAHWGAGIWPGPDFWPALIAGAIYNLVAHRTRRLSSCVVAHAMTNLLLGFYIMRTGQWGFW
jgi:CAAX prenyl protease-like protein